MHEPPIASPFGSYEPDKLISDRLPTPLLLKIFVGIELISATITSVAYTFGFGLTSNGTAHHRILTDSYIFVLLVIFLVYYWLLRGNKVSWWLMMAYYFCVFSLSFIRTFIRHAPRTASVYPPLVSSLLSAISLAFFVYLLLPQTRRFFFPLIQESPSQS